MPVLRSAFLAGVSVLALLLGGCSGLPQRGEVAAQADRDGEIAFNLVRLDDAVVDVLAAWPRPVFRERFKKYVPAPELKIAVGDTVSVVIWEASAAGLFGNSLPETSLPETSLPETSLASGTAGRPGTAIPAQPVGPDGTITIPYAGRVIAAGRTATGLGRRIQALLGPIAIDPQALVRVQRGAGNAVTVAGDIVKGALVPLAPGGTRLLDVIAASGGAGGPVHEIVVRLSRGGITATVPLSVLIADPAQNIFARPGDVLILSRVPQTISVFGASGRNAALTFDTEQMSLAEALAKAGGLRDERADARAIFVMRYEPAELVRALGQRVAARAPAGLSPVVYRLDLADAKSYLLAKRFAVRDQDIVFVAQATLVPITRALESLPRLAGPVTGGLLVCRAADKC